MTTQDETLQAVEHNVLAEALGDTDWHPVANVKITYRVATGDPADPATRGYDVKGFVCDYEDAREFVLHENALLLVEEIEERAAQIGATVSPVIVYRATAALARQNWTEVA